MNYLHHYLDLRKNAFVDNLFSIATFNSESGKSDIFDIFINILYNFFIDE